MSMIVYVFSNPAMPGLVKIGKVETVDRIQSRLAELYRGASGVPVPFKCECAVEIKDEGDWERILHRLFDRARLNPRREFFELPEEDLILVLRKFGKDVTPSLDMFSEGISQGEIKSAERLHKQRPRMRLSDLNVPDGAVLVWARDREQECTVVNAHENLVRFRGEEMTLTEATRQLLGDPSWYPRAALYWEYQGQLLAVLYDEKYSPERED